MNRKQLYLIAALIVCSVAIYCWHEYRQRAVAEQAAEDEAVARLKDSYYTSHHTNSARTNFMPRGAVRGTNTP